MVRSAAPDPTLVTYLSSLLARARGALGRRPDDLAGPTLRRFFTETFPAALYRTRRWWLVDACWPTWSSPSPWAGGSSPTRRWRPVAVTPPRSSGSSTPTSQDYYSEFAASHFAARVWTNNAWVAALCIAFGVLGLPVIYVLFQNIVNVALTGAIMVGHGRGALFFGLILPHGLLELTAVFVAAGVGLRLFWAWVEPGPRTRAQALADEGRTAVAIALGLVVVLLVSGVIEAFVTPSPLPTWARIGDRRRGRGRRSSPTCSPPGAWAVPAWGDR